VQAGFKGSRATWYRLRQKAPYGAKGLDEAPEVKHAGLARKQAQEETGNTSGLSKTAQEKLDAAIGAYKRKLYAGFEKEVEDRLRSDFHKTIEPWMSHFKERLERADAVLKAYKGVMSRATYRKIWSCLHPDSRHGVTEERLNEAFDVFAKLENVLVKIETPKGPAMPSLAELMARRQKVAEERRARYDSVRQGKRGPVGPTGGN